MFVSKAFLPTATFLVPVVFVYSADEPIATLSFAVVLFPKASAPKAVL